MISKELSETLGFAVKEAKKRRHEYVSVEHVLFAILHDESGVDIIKTVAAMLRASRPRLKNFSTSASTAYRKKVSMCFSRPSDFSG